MADPNFDLVAADRWFAVETNNETWNWLYDNASGEAGDPIINVAHASLYHWNRVGTTINRARAASLVANVHSTLGNGALAVALARQSLELTAEAGDEAQDWDVAFAQDSLGRALSASGDPAAADQRIAARRAGDAIVEAGDKEVFDEWFALPNGWPST
ncbi:MAG: tetratricopeptide repeat protein [Acidimicrobiia bacterium]